MGQGKPACRGRLPRFLARLECHYDLLCGTSSLRECIFSNARQAWRAVKTLDISTRLICHGFHPCTASPFLDRAARSDD